MITYPDGTQALVGDFVTIDHIHIPGEIEAVIDSNSEMNTWGLDERGLMVRTTLYGLMFQPVDSLEWDDVVFIRRADT